MGDRPPGVAELDLEKLTARLTTTIEQARNHDPREGTRAAGGEPCRLDTRAPRRSDALRAGLAAAKMTTKFGQANTAQTGDRSARTVRP